MFKSLRRQRPPLHAVLQAWWQSGDDLPTPANVTAPTAKTAVAVDDSSPGSEPANEWPPERIKVVEEMWGRGETTPLSAESTIDLLNWAGLVEGHQFLDLRAGLGSVLKLAARTFNIQVAGLEPLEGLAEEANRRWTRGRPTVKPIVNVYDPETVELPPDSYHCIWARNVVCGVDDKARFLSTIVNALKPGGFLLVADLLLDDSTKPTSLLDAWNEGEHSPRELWTEDQLTEAMREHGLKDVTTKDLTLDYRNMILQGLAGFINRKRAGGNGFENPVMIVREAEYWARRVAAIDSGDLRMAMVRARKPVPKKNLTIRTMSDL